MSIGHFQSWQAAILVHIGVQISVRQWSFWLCRRMARHVDIFANKLEKEALFPFH